MIYLDTSVVLAAVLAEDRAPAEDLWGQDLVASRLLLYELWVCLHARRLGTSHADHAGALLGRVALVELAPRVLARAIEPFPEPVRTLDALHLATMVFLREQGQTVALASYDDRMVKVARRLRIRIHGL